MKKLDWYEVGESIIIKKDDLEIVEKHFNEEVDLFYDEFGRIFNEGGIYIADIKKVIED